MVQLSRAYIVGFDGRHLQIAGDSAEEAVVESAAQAVLETVTLDGIVAVGDTTCIIPAYAPC
jgi:hypothetical protein